MDLELTVPHFSFRHALKFLWPWTMMPPANQFGSWSPVVQCFPQPQCPATTVSLQFHASQQCHRALDSLAPSKCSLSTAIAATPSSSRVAHACSFTQHRSARLFVHPAQKCRLVRSPSTVANPFFPPFSRVRPVPSPPPLSLTNMTPPHLHPVRHDVVHHLVMLVQHQDDVTNALGPHLVDAVEQHLEEEELVRHVAADEQVHAGGPQGPAGKRGRGRGRRGRGQ